MKKNTDFVYIAGFLVVFTVIYIPALTSRYVFTDEIVQLWYYGKKNDFQMFLPQGRGITEKLMLFVFGNVDHIDQLWMVRGFSWAGWLLSIPIWYYVLKDVVRRNEQSFILVLLGTGYLICIPGVTISVVWASCLELFLANTAGLLSGYFLFRALRLEGHRLEVSGRFTILSVLFGIISLFTYQNGFGCFFIPFVLHFLSDQRKQRFIWVGLIGYFVIVAVYFLLFKYNLRVEGIVASDRTSIQLDPFRKLLFFFGRPLRSAFSFTWLFNEHDRKGYIPYVVCAIAWLFAYLRRNKNESMPSRLGQLVFLAAMLILTYLPGFIVRENYASNRTLIALNLAVFFMVIEMIVYYAKSQRYQRLWVAVLLLLFFINGWYNCKYLFLKPQRHEYAQMRSAIERSYNNGVRTFYFIRPEEEFMSKYYHITRSWDEFGVASSFFDWVPEYFTKQVIFEITGNRAEADRVIVKQWLGRDAFQRSGEELPEGAALIDAAAIIAGK